MIKKLPKLNALDAHIVMRDQYELRYGIMSPEQQRHPLSSVLMHPCEEVASTGKLRDLYEEFATKQYREMWGLSVDEFFDRPIWVVDMMREISDEVLRKRGRAVESLTNSAKTK